MASAAHGGMLSFNMNDGFCDAVVRGMRSGFLAEDEYHHLVRCETIEGTYLLAHVALADSSLQKGLGEGTILTMQMYTNAMMMVNQMSS